MTKLSCHASNGWLLLLSTWANHSKRRLTRCRKWPWQIAVQRSFRFDQAPKSWCQKVHISTPWNFRFFCVRRDFLILCACSLRRCRKIPSNCSSHQQRFGTVTWVPEWLTGTLGMEISANCLECTCILLISSCLSQFPRSICPFRRVLWYVCYSNFSVWIFLFAPCQLPYLVCVLYPLFSCHEICALHFFLVRSPFLCPNMCALQHFSVQNYLFPFGCTNLYVVPVQYALSLLPGCVSCMTCSLHAYASCTERTV